MPPTETEVLTHYLLQPASLDAIITFAAFAERFPPATRDSPSVRALWNDLVAQREKTLDEVRRNIEREVEQGKIMRREVLKARKAEGRVDEDGEVEMERALFGGLSGASGAKHTLDSIIPELDGAAGALEMEIEQLRQEEETLLESVRQTVGGLSDLRYGKFANAKVSDEVKDGLETLRETCDSK